MTTKVTGAKNSVLTGNGTGPFMGPQQLTETIDFSVVGTSPKSINFAARQAEGVIDFIQSVYCDNSLNAQALTITCNLTQHNVTFPAFSQGFLPLLVPKRSGAVTITTSGNVAVNIHFCSQANPAQLWYPYGMSGTVGTDYSSSQPALAAHLLGTIPAGTIGNNTEVQNQSADTIQCVLDDGAGNNLSVWLLASGGANAQGADKTWTGFTGRLRVYSANAGDQCYIRRY